MHSKNLTEEMNLPLFDGKRDPDRRRKVEEGKTVYLEADDGTSLSFNAARFKKKVPTYAVGPMHYPLKINTLEGIHLLEKGAYLAIGQSGELYPIAADIFQNTYELDEDNA